VLALDGEPRAAAADDPALAELLAAATVCDLVPPALRQPAPAPAIPANDYAGFLSDVVAAVTQHVEPWKQRLAEASGRWGALGYAVRVLDRALSRPTPPNVDGLLATFDAAVAHLRELEALATAVEPDLAGSPIFRDPERVSAAEAVFARLLPAGPDPRLTSAAFLVGDSNGAAVAAAGEVARDAAASRTPFYLHGPSGSGRTHLLAATANALRATRGGRAAYVNARDFADELAAAMQANTVERWRARYRVLDVLAVDDVHALAGHPRAEQELALLSVTLRERGRQLLLAGEADPADVVRMGEAVRLQVARGVAASIGAPDRALRARLVAARFEAAGRHAGDDVVRYLAERAESSAHTVAPLVQRVIAAAERAGAPLTLAVARGELGRTPALTPLASVASGGAAPGRSDPFFLDPEKVVLDWPDVGARAIEELR
jgi:hypothetical protein